MTTTSLEELLALANLAASTGDDMTEAVKGGGGGRILPTGYAFATLVEYIEYGQQPQEFGGVAKEPALEVQLAFALTGDGYANPDGTPYIFRCYPMALSRNEKANAYLLFKTMNWKGTATHFAQLLGQHYLLPIENPAPAAGKKPRSKANTKGILPPLCPVTKAPYPIAAARPEDLKLFLWDYPQVETWASFYQEGKYEDGNSKNAVQEKMLSALDFHGSALMMMLNEKGVPYTIPTPAAKPAAPPAAAGPAAPAAPGAPVAPPVAVVAPTVPAAMPAPPPSGPATPALPVVPTVAAPPAVSSPAVAAVAPPAVAMPSLPAMPAMPAMPPA